jgi:hypothetical protein
MKLTHRVLLLAAALVSPAYANQLCCANEAKTILAPVYISNDAALVTNLGDAGSAVYDFGTLSGSLWAKTRCPDGNSDSWRVNGQVWHIADSTQFIWQEFGTVPEAPNAQGTTEIHFEGRESGCEIQAIFLGDDGASILLNSQPTKDCNSAYERGYVCPALTALTSPVYLDSTTGSIVSDWGFPLAGDGAAHFEFGWNYGPAPLWFLTQCTEGSRDSWFVNGNVWHVPDSTEFEWHMFGMMGTNEITLTPREPGCRIAAAYYGKDTPSTEYAQDCPANNEFFCPIQGEIEGNIFGKGDNVIYAPCPANINNPGPCSGSATYEFDNAGAFWAKTQCDSGSSDSWYVNGEVWHVPHSTTFQWHKFGNPADNELTITLQVREANCRIAGLFRGHGNPGLFERNCPVSLKPTTSECPVRRPEGKPLVESDITVFYSQHASVHRARVNALAGTLIENNMCMSGFASASGIAVDDQEGVYVVDYGSSSLQYIFPGCQTRKTVIGQNSPIGVPKEVTILHSYGLLAVTTVALPGIYYVEVDCNHDVFNFVNSGATNALAGGITQCSDPYGNDGFIFVEGGNALAFWDVQLQRKTYILPAPSGVVDIGDVDYSCIGIMFTANDNNQVWMCSPSFDFTSSAVAGLGGTKDTEQFDPNANPQTLTQAPCVMPAHNCFKMCDKRYDGSSCEYLMNPQGIATDLLGNVYVGNSGNGNFVMYRRGERDGILLTTDVYANDLELCERSFCEGKQFLL